MRVRRVENVIVLAHMNLPPSDDEWRDYIENVLAIGRVFGNDLRRCRHLVFTDGGGPDARQREAVSRVADQMNAKEMPIAVVSSSAFVRVIVTLGRAFNMNIRAWAPGEIRAAFAALGIGPSTARSLWVDLDAMDGELEGVQSIRGARDAFGKV